MHSLLRFATCGFAVGWALLAGSVLAQAFPSKTVRMVVPNANVGLPDALARMVASRMSESIGQAVVVENRPSGGGLIAGEQVVKSASDGHTLLLFGNGEYAVAPALYAGRMPYDVSRDLAPVTQAVRGAYFLVASAGLGVTSVQEFIALAKTRPGMNYASPGNGQIPHLALAQLALMAGLQMTHVPYKGVAQSIPALITGDVSVSIMSLGAALPHVKAGKLRILANASGQRAPQMPELATIAESGVPGFEVANVLGFFVHSGTPRPLVERLHGEFVKALRAADTEARLAGFGTEVVAGTPEQFAELVRRDQEHYGKLVRQLGLKID